MHQVVKLNLPHATEGKLYLEDGGRRVLHVFSDLSTDDSTAIDDLRRELAKFVGTPDGYDDCVVHPKKSANADRT